MTNTHRQTDRLRRAGKLTGLMGLALVLLLFFPGESFSQNGVFPNPKHPDQVFVAGSGNTAFNLHFVELLKAKLGPEVDITPYSDSASIAQPETLVISLGARALSRVHQQSPKPPTLALMVSEKQFSGYRDRSGARISAIYNDPPLLQQALLGTLILPQATRIALLVRPGEEKDFEPLIANLRKLNLDGRVFTVDGNDTLIATLSRALSYGDFLLALPDEVIFNPRTIKHILLTAYRRNRIVIGPNRAFVGAGALASTYTPITTVVDGVARHLNAYSASGQLLPADHPSDFAVDVNTQVARSLNIPVRDVATLERLLKEQLNALPTGVTP
ncbi:ABC transporter substrate-binding protein [Marinobacter caseinilyticus]|uniref:ABC transporter substrate-binding protein n=1 Tax=Marinobacter caseinilyticus TaxID=2692195 RepID=UPI00140AE9FC|nr:ABC transporter substrate-binding protein [Marinobacter caseinilyticus]